MRRIDVAVVIFLLLMVAIGGAAMGDKPHISVSRGHAVASKCAKKPPPVPAAEADEEDEAATPEQEAEDAEEERKLTEEGYYP